MKLQRKIKISKLLIFALIVGIAGLVCASLWLQEEMSVQKETRSPSSFSSASGISFVETRGDKLVYRVSMDKFSVERAKFGPFAIGPLIVAKLSKVTVDLYREGIELSLEEEAKKNGEWARFDIQAPISSIRRNLPYKIKTLKLDGISFNLWEEGKKVFSLSSENASFDRQTGEVVFTGRVKMDAGENGNLLCHRVRWDRKTGLFRVMDPYLLTKSGKEMEGRGIETDYTLKKIIKVAAQK